MMGKQDCGTIERSRTQVRERLVRMFQRIWNRNSSKLEFVR
jgi:hypothetical protein